MKLFCLSSAKLTLERAVERWNFVRRELEFCQLFIYQFLLIRVSVSDRCVLTSLGTDLGKMRDLLKLI